MDNLPGINPEENQSQGNSTTNPTQNMETTNNSEFAEKQPLVMPQTIRKWAIRFFGGLGLIIILIASIYFFVNINRPQIINEPEVPVVEEPEEIPDTQRIAYIKNGNSIWSSDLNGENKERYVEIPIDSENEITSINWKDKDNLGYTNCDSGGNCELSSYNLESRSITPELTKDTTIEAFAWSPDLSYLAYVENNSSNTVYRLKLGTVDTKLTEFGYERDETLTVSQVFFTSDSRYVIYSSLKKDLPAPDRNGNIDESKAEIYPVIYVYQVNGSPVDQITNASDPFLIDDQTLAYRTTGGQLLYSVIGTGDETEIADFVGFNPEISMDKKNVAYWRNETGGNIVVLGIYDSNLNIHRNILRGVVLPVWINNQAVVGIKADSCFAENCLLYEFKTASMVIVDIQDGNVTSVDQGKSLSKAVLRPE